MENTIKYVLESTLSVNFGTKQYKRKVQRNEIIYQ